MKRNKLANFVADNYVRLLPALVIAVAAGGLGLKYMLSSFAATTDTTIITSVQDVTTGGAAADANSAASAIAVRPGDTVQYTVAIANRAPSGLFGGKTLSGVKVTDTIPANFQLTTDPSAKTIALTFGDIPAGKTITRSFSVKVASSTAATVENIACYATTAQLFQTSEKGCDSAFVRIAPVVVATTPPPAPKPSPSPSSKTPTPAAKTPTPAPSPTPAATPAASVAAASAATGTCSAVANGTVKSGSAGVDITVPSAQTKAVQIAYGTDATNLDSKSSLTVSKGDNTTVVIPSLKAGTTYSYQIIRQCGDDSYKTSDTGSFSTEKLSVNVVFTSSDNDPLEGISSSFSCAETSNATSDSTGMVSYAGIAPGDCKLNYNYQSKQCSNLLSIPQPSLSAQVSSADVITLTYKVKACAEQSGDNINGAASKGGLSGNKAALIFGILSLVLAALLVMSYLKQHRSNNGGPGAGLSGGDNTGGGFTPPTDMPPSNDASAAYGGGAAAGYAGSIAYDDSADASATPADAETYASDAATTADYGTVDPAAAPAADVNGDYYAPAEPVDPSATPADAPDAPLPADYSAVAAEAPIEQPVDQSGYASADAPVVPEVQDASADPAAAPIAADPGTYDQAAADQDPTVDEAATPAEAPAEAPAAPLADAGDEAAAPVEAAAPTAATSDDGSLDIPHQPSA